MRGLVAGFLTKLRRYEGCTSTQRRNFFRFLRAHGRRLLFLRAADITHGHKKMGDLVVATVDGNIDRRHAPTVCRVHVGTFAHGFLNRRHIIAMHCLEQLSGDLSRSDSRRCGFCRGLCCHDQREGDGSRASRGEKVAGNCSHESSSSHDFAPDLRILPVQQASGNRSLPRFEPYAVAGVILFPPVAQDLHFYGYAALPETAFAGIQILSLSSRENEMTMQQRGEPGRTARRLGVGLAALCIVAASTSLVSTASAAGVKARAAQRQAAAPHCVSDRDLDALNMRVLQTELMVAALSCDQRTQYNNFVTSNRDTLAERGRVLQAFFNRTHGARGEFQLNSFITKIANDTSKDVRSKGDEYCVFTEQLFDEVAAVPSSDLSRVARKSWIIQRHGYQPCVAEAESKKRAG